MLACLAAFFIAAPPAVALQTQPSAEKSQELVYAEKLLADGYTELAIAQYRLFLERYGAEKRAPEVLRKIADAYVSQGAFAEARPYFERLLIRHSASPFAQDALLQIAQCYEREQRLQEAAKNFERFALLNESLPAAAGAFLHAARIYLQQHERLHGRQLIYRVIEKFPEDSEALAQANYLLIQDLMQSSEYRRALELAEAFLRNFSEITATPAVWMLKAGIYEKLGQYTQALQTLESVQSRFIKSDLALAARLNVARLSLRLGDSEKAKSALESLQMAGNDSLAARAALMLAGVRLEEGNSADALAALKSIRTDQLAVDRLALAGRIYEKLADHARALQAFEAALRKLPAGFDARRAVLHYNAARSAYGANLGVDAAAHADSALAAASGDALAPFVLLLQGDIYFRLFQDAARASRLFARFLERYPEHAQVDAAQAKLAACYEKLRSWELAGTEWQRLLRNYPASSYFVLARSHLETIQKYYTRDLTQTVERMIEEMGADGALRDVDLRKAEMFSSFRHYRKALPLLKKVLSRQPVEAERPRALYLLGQAYFALGEMARLQRRPQADALFDSASVVLHLVRERYAQKTESAGLDLSLARLALYRLENHRAVNLDSVSLAHADDIAFAPVHAHVLTAGLRTVAQQDSAQQAQYLMRLFKLANHTETTLHNRANLLIARFALLKKDTTTALSRLNLIVQERLADPDLAAAELLRARLLAAQGEFANSMQSLQMIRTKYFYSAFADSALYYLAANAARQEHWREAVDYLDALRSRRKSLVAATEETLWPSALLLKARAHAASGDDLRAMQSLLAYTRRARTSQEMARALLELGKLAEKLHVERLAKEYYNSVFTRYGATPEAHRARMALANLAFRQGHYSQARELAQQMLQASPIEADDAISLHKLAIVAMLRQNKFAPVRPEIRNFKKRFKQAVAAQAEIQYELGEFYIRQKNFKQADKIFKSLRKKYKSSPYAIRGDFGLGKSLLYQTKTEDALEILTEIPNKYPDEPFLRVVYLNLGDFYMQQQQWDIAIESFKKVIADSLFDTEHKVALGRLSELYENIGLYDAALTYTRRYLQAFPGSTDRMVYEMRVGTLLRNLRLYDEAVEHYRRLRLVAHGEEAIAVQYFIGLSYFEAGKFELAIGELLKLRYENLQTKFPWRTTAIYKAGEAYMKLNNLERARQQFDFVLRTEGVNSQFGRFARNKIRLIEQATAQTIDLQKKS